MSETVKRVLAALNTISRLKKQENHFPYLADQLYRAGVFSSTWTLPSCQAIYVTDTGNMVIPGEPLFSGPMEVSPFSEEKLRSAIREDQKGESAFPVFLTRIWAVGVVSYRVDFAERVVTYYGAQGDEWEESYPAVSSGWPV